MVAHRVLAQKVQRDLRLGLVLAEDDVLHAQRTATDSIGLVLLLLIPASTETRGQGDRSHVGAGRCMVKLLYTRHGVPNDRSGTGPPHAAARPSYGWTTQRCSSS